MNITKSNCYQKFRRLNFEITTKYLRLSSIKQLIAYTNTIYIILTIKLVNWVERKPKAKVNLTINLEFQNFMSPFIKPLDSKQHVSMRTKLYNCLKCAISDLSLITTNTNLLWRRWNLTDTNKIACMPRTSVISRTDHVSNCQLQLVVVIGIIYEINM